jgi:excisionase family DNA binding protein
MLLTVREVSKLLQIKPSTLYAWAAQRRIPCFKLHGLVRFRREEIDQWLESCHAPSEVKAVQPIQRRAVDLSRVIARAKRAAYNSRHGEARHRSSPIGKEAADGAV